MLARSCEQAMAKWQFHTCDMTTRGSQYHQAEPVSRYFQTSPCSWSILHLSCEHPFAVFAAVLKGGAQ